jgi:hypothetical protein
VDYLYPEVGNSVQSKFKSTNTWQVRNGLKFNMYSIWVLSDGMKIYTPASVKSD